MDKSSILTLISQTFSEDDIGQETATETKREVFCEVNSITRAEWFSAGRNGMKPDYSFTMIQYDYEGETECEYMGIRYGIYRTYITKNDDIELYVEKKAGIQ